MAYFFWVTMGKALLLESPTVAVSYVCIFYPYIWGGFCKTELLKLPKFQNSLQEKTGFNTPLLYGFILMITYLADPSQILTHVSLYINGSFKLSSAVRTCQKQTAYTHSLVQLNIGSGSIKTPSQRQT